MPGRRVQTGFGYRVDTQGRASFGVQPASTDKAGLDAPAPDKIAARITGRQLVMRDALVGETADIDN
ncbi:hypothetical protein AB0M64_18475 [Streptomyces sp. NPDC051771]|uniref:hypothetical protein n=1 Tax=Streptomyces sp. NPDC051771 TaxID=3154847 RepID=UPI00341CC94A